MDYRQDIPPRIGLDTCAKGRKPLTRHDRVLDLKIVAGIGPHPRGYGECTYISEHSEYAHVACKAAALDAPFIEIPRSRLDMTAEIASLSARVPDYQCVRCKKRFVKGDRIIGPVFIVEGIGIDPETKNKAVQCAGEFEMSHYDCNEPGLSSGL